MKYTYKSEMRVIRRKQIGVVVVLEAQPQKNLRTPQPAFTGRKIPYPGLAKLHTEISKSDYPTRHLWHHLLAEAVTLREDERVKHWLIACIYSNTWYISSRTHIAFNLTMVSGSVMNISFSQAEQAIPIAPQIRREFCRLSLFIHCKHYQIHTVWILLKYHLRYYRP